MVKWKYICERQKEMFQFYLSFRYLQYPPHQMSCKIPILTSYYQLSLIVLCHCNLSEVATRLLLFLNFLLWFCQVFMFIAFPLMEQHISEKNFLGRGGISDRMLNHQLYNSIYNWGWQGYELYHLLFCSTSTILENMIRTIQYETKGILKVLVFHLENVSIIWSHFPVFFSTLCKRKTDVYEPEHDWRHEIAGILSKTQKVLG